MLNNNKNNIIIYNQENGKLNKILSSLPFILDQDNLYSHCINKEQRLILGVDLEKFELDYIEKNFNSFNVYREPFTESSVGSILFKNKKFTKTIYDDSSLKNLPIIISGHIVIAAGYSRLTRLSINELLKHDNLKIELYDVSNPLCSSCIEETYPEYKNYFIDQKKYYSDNNKILFAYLPPNINFPRKKFNIAYTMLECYTVKQSYQRIVDSSWDHFIVPTKFCKDLFSEFISPDRISLIHSGIDTNIFHPNIEKEQNIKFKKVDYNLRKIVETDEKPKGFKFLNVSRFSHRKGCDLLIKSYAEEFSNKDDVSLVMFCMSENEINPDHVESSILKLLNKHFIKNKELAPIFIVNTPYEENKQSLPYSWGDCLVFPSRGEGLGLPPLEAGACGLPLICSINSGLSDYISEENSFTIEHDLIDDIGKVETGLGYMGNYPEWRHDAFFPHLCNVKFAIMNSPEILIQIQEKMRFVYENYSSQIVQNKIKNMTNLIHEKYNWNKNSIKIYDFFKKIV